MRESTSRDQMTLSKQQVRTLTITICNMLCVIQYAMCNGENILMLMMLRYSFIPHQHIYRDEHSSIFFDNHLIIVNILTHTLSITHHLLSISCHRARPPSQTPHSYHETTATPPQNVSLSRSRTDNLARMCGTRRRMPSTLSICNHRELRCVSYPSLVSCFFFLLPLVMFT